MYHKVVIPGMDLGSRLFNSSCKPYNNLDSRFTMRYPGMTKCGFTLIELLVVVLIIGILSAVALPQYQLAVDKARWSNMVALTEPFRKAVEIAYMANGAPPGWDELDLDMPSSCRLIGGQKDHYDCDGLYIDLYAGTTLNLRAWGGALGTNVQYYTWFDFSPYPGRRECRATSARGIKLCKSLGGVESGGVYVLP